MKKLGIIGCGNVATEILKSNLSNVGKVYVYDIDEEKSYLLAEHFVNLPIHICRTIQQVIKNSDIIIESASVSAVSEILQQIKKFPQKHLLILSVGGLIKNFKLYKKLISNGYKIHIPSGAIAGCDALLAAKVDKIRHIHLKTTKPTKTLLSAPYFLTHKNIYSKVLKNDTVTVFKGDVYDAVKYFPQNINVAATLAVLCGDFKKVSVEIVASKHITRNVHEVTIYSSAGEIYTRTENIPSPNNPKTSFLAVLSTISVLNSILRE